MNAFRLLLASGVVLAVIASTAWIDHDRKGAAMHKASQAAWFCKHKQRRCGGGDPDAIERSWSRREAVYRAGFGATAVLGAISFAFWGRSVIAKR